LTFGRPLSVYLGSVSSVDVSGTLTSGRTPDSTTVKSSLSFEARVYVVAATVTGVVCVGAAGEFWG